MPLNRLCCKVAVSPPVGRYMRPLGPCSSSLFRTLHPYIHVAVAGLDPAGFNVCAEVVASIREWAVMKVGGGNKGTDSVFPQRCV